MRLHAIASNSYFCVSITMTTQFDPAILFWSLQPWCQSALLAQRVCQNAYIVKSSGTTCHQGCRQDAWSPERHWSSPAHCIIRHKTPLVVLRRAMTWSPPNSQNIDQWHGRGVATTISRVTLGHTLRQMAGLLSWQLSGSSWWKLKCLFICHSNTCSIGTSFYFMWCVCMQ